MIFEICLFRTPTLNYSHEDLPPSRGQHLRAPNRQDYLSNRDSNLGPPGLRTPDQSVLQQPSTTHTAIGADRGMGTEKLLTPGSPMEAMRRRFPTGAGPRVEWDPRQRHSVAEPPLQPQQQPQSATSPLVAVPIMETQIGIKRANLRARSPNESGMPPGTTTMEDPYADPGTYSILSNCRGGCKKRGI